MFITALRRMPVPSNLMFSCQLTLPRVRAQARDSKSYRLAVDDGFVFKSLVSLPGPWLRCQGWRGTVLMKQRRVRQEVKVW